MTNIAGPIPDVDVECLDLQVQHRLFVDVTDEYNSQPFECGFELIDDSVIFRMRVLWTPTCSFAVMTCALAIGWELALVVTGGPLDLAVVASIVHSASGSGFWALALTVLPYISRALLVMFIIRLIS